MYKENVDNTQSLQNTADIFLETITQKDKFKHACVVGLIGTLGSGKTTFTQFTAQKLGIKDNVLSPTFVIEKIYKIPDNKTFSNFIHIDAYRIEDEKELKVLGWDEIIENEENLIFVEWADKIENILPEDTIKIHFSFINNTTREISW